MASEKMAGKKRGKKARRTVVDMTMEQVEAVKAQLTMLTAACERAEHDFGNEIGAHNAGFKKSGTAFANSAKAMVGDARRRLASIEALYFGVDESEVDSDDDE
jgi:hypothetical protein